MLSTMILVNQASCPLKCSGHDKLHEVRAPQYMPSMLCNLQVLWMGKPDPIIYTAAQQMLQLPKEKVIAIGDSLQHDIQGTAGQYDASHVFDCAQLIAWLVLATVLCI